MSATQCTQGEQNEAGFSLSEKHVEASRSQTKNAVPPTPKHRTSSSSSDFCIRDPREMSCDGSELLIVWSLIVELHHIPGGGGRGEGRGGDDTALRRDFV